jgi:hypothetical protein
VGNEFERIVYHKNVKNVLETIAANHAFSHDSLLSL